MKQIIAGGGGGFMGEDNMLLDYYILAQSNKKNPKVCFLPTASGDMRGLIGYFHKTFENLPCIPKSLSVFNPPVEGIKERLLSSDVIYVGGGNTKCMLGLWKEFEIDKILVEAYHKGIVLAGFSAGAVCWFDNFISDAFPGTYVVLNGLNLLPGSFAPHYNGQLNRRPEYIRHIDENKIAPGVGVDDCVAIHYVDGKISKVISSEQDCYAYSVYKDNENMLEEQITPQYLNCDEEIDKIFASPTFMDLE